MFIWVTARYLWQWKCQCKCGKGRYNIAQKVKTLLVYKDKNAVSVFCIYIEVYAKVEIET